MPSPIGRHRPLCGAKTRTGGTCQNRKMPNGRCRMHGGKSTGPKDQRGNQNAITHGIYAGSLSDDEAALWDEIKLGSLDDDIKIAKLQLRRALIEQRRVDDAADAAEPGLSSHLEISEIRETPGPLDKDGKPTVASAITRKPGHLREIINRLLGRIGELELRRVTIVTELGGGSEETITIEGGLPARPKPGAPPSVSDAGLDAPDSLFDPTKA